MAEFPALPLFTDAIAADCHHLTDEEFGRYMRLLIIMWRTPGCTIPNDPDWICKRLKIDTLAYARHVQPIMQEFCTEIELNGHKRLIQKRLLKEYNYVVQLRKKRSDAAKKKWEIEKQGNYDLQGIPTADAPTPTPTPLRRKKNINIPKKKKVSLESLSVGHVRSWLSEKRLQGKYIHHNENFILEQFKDYCRSKGRVYKDYVAAYRNAFEWDRCQPKEESNGRQTKDDRAKRAIREAAVAGGFAPGSE